MFKKIKNAIKKVIKYIKRDIKKVEKKIYNWHPDLPDIRDFMYHLTHKIETDLPSAVDLRSKCPHVLNQMTLGSCTAHALAENLCFLDSPDTDFDFSRLFIYYNERLLEGTVNIDNGAMLRDGIKALAKWGVCPETLWPYDIKVFNKQPSAEAYLKALDHRISSYSRINCLDEMKNCLASGYPFVFGFTVYTYFQSAEMAKTGVLKMPEAWERILGGHAVLAVGYDDAKQMVLVRNSWGENWGQGGHFWMPYAYISNDNLACDMWSIRK